MPSDAVLVAVYAAGWLCCAIIVARIVAYDICLGKPDMTCGLFGAIVGLSWPVLLAFLILYVLVGKPVAWLAGRGY